MSYIPYMNMIVAVSGKTKLNLFYYIMINICIFKKIRALSQDTKGEEKKDSNIGWERNETKNALKNK